MSHESTVPAALVPGSVSQDSGRTTVASWWPIAAGMLVLYVPTYLRLARDFWVQQEYAHGPVVLAVVLWLAWRGRGTLIGHAATAPQVALGGGILFVGLLCYVLGRSQDIPLLEVASQIPVLGGSLLLMRGAFTLRRLWFALFFLLFLVPLPGIIVDPLTGQLKQHVSAIAESLLYSAGYPVARSGVVLTIGQYQLLIADACSGLHSLITMAAMGMLYIYLTGNRSLLRDAVMIAALFPIAFAANVVRVIVLVLVTYRFGDEAGQGFIHSSSGILLFAIGLLGLFALDALLGISGSPRPGGAR